MDFGFCGVSKRGKDCLVVNIRNQLKGTVNNNLQKEQFETAKQIWHREHGAHGLYTKKWSQNSSTLGLFWNRNQLKATVKK